MPDLAIKTERYVASIFAALENLFHAAVIFGWPSLVYVLKDRGYYSNLCPSDPMVDNSTAIPDVTSGSTTHSVYDETPVMCDEQDARLLLIYTVVSSVLPVAMLFIGILFERTGHLLTRMIVSVLLPVGYLFIGFSSPEIPHLLFPGAVVISAAGMFIFVSTLEVSNLFPAQKSTIIGFFNGCVDTSSCVMLLVKVTYDAGIVPMEVSFFILAASTLFFNINTILLPRGHIPWPLPKDYRLLRCGSTQSEGGKESIDDDDDDTVTMATGCYLGYDPHHNMRNACTQTFGLHSFQTNGRDDLSVEIEVYDNKGFADEEKEEKYITNSNADNPADEKESDSQFAHAENTRKSDFPSLWSCFKSPMFLLMSLWSISCQCSILFVIGIMNAWLTWLADGDTEIVSFYTNILAIMNVGSLIGAPVAGLLFDRKKLQLCRKGDDTENKSRGPYDDLKDSCLPVALATTLAVALSICMLIPILPVQYVTFVILTLVKSMFYGASAAVVPVTFPMEFYPTIFGAANFLIGVVAFLQYPLFILIQEVLAGDPRLVIAGFMVANILTFSYPAYIYYYVRKKDKLRHAVIETTPSTITSAPQQNYVAS